MFRLTTLGAIDLRDRLGRPVRDVLSQPKRIALLIHLTVEGARGPASRDRLLAMFWPESDETRARNALSQALYHLRQALGPDVISGQGATIDIARDQIWCDALVFGEALARGDAELALDLHRGEFCPSLVVSGAPGFEEWASETRRVQRRRLLSIVRAAVDRSSGAGEHTVAARLARRAMALVPDDEADVRAHLEAIERAGDVTGALAAYAEYEERLRVTLETTPAPETKRVVDAIRRRRAAMGAAAPSDGAAATEPARPTAMSMSTPAAGPRDDTRAPHSRSPRTAVLIAATLVLVVTGSVALRARWSAARESPAARAVAVFPFTTRGSEAIGFLGDGMPDLLAVKLDGTSEMRSIDPRSSVAAARGLSLDAASGEALARSLGAGYFVLGNVTEAAGRVEVNGALHEVGHAARAVVTATVAGDTASLFSLVDDLAGRLLAGVLGGRDTTLTRLAAVTTTSLPALKAYLRGERFLRAGEDAQAAAAFREAALIDTTFALAQYRFSVTMTWATIASTEDPAVWAALAARNDGRLTPLGHDLLEAYRSYRTFDGRAEGIYRTITQSHPDNIEAWFMLGETLFHYGPLFGRSPSDSRPALERVLTLDPANAHAMLHLARLSAIEGRVAELDSLAAMYLARHDSLPRALEIRALQAWVRRDSASSARIVREATDADELLLESLLLAAGSYVMDPDAARAIGTRLLATAQSRTARRIAEMLLADIEIGAGRWSHAGRPAQLVAGADADWALESEVLAAVEPVFAVSRAHLTSLRDRVAGRRAYPALGVPQTTLPSALGEPLRAHLLALLSVRLGDTVAVRRHLGTIDASARGPDSVRVLSLAASARAEQARADGRHADALADLDRFPIDISLQRFPHPVERDRFMRGELLLALGRDAEALPWFESLVGYFDFPFLAVAQLRQGQIHERAGRRERAAECYRRALGLWRGADAGFAPLVAAAREGLARVD